jgi:hypothetical protein
MALTRDDNLTQTKKIDKLQGSLSSTNKKYNDLMFEKLGTLRKSELIGKIGDKHISYKQLINNYINGL